MMQYQKLLLTLLSLTLLSVYPWLENNTALAQESLEPLPTPSSTSTTPQRKLRVAVLDFDFSSISDPSVLNLFPGQSKGVSDILINRLVSTDNFTVVERSKIDAVLAEQNFGASGRIDQSTAAEIGRILGVDLIILGSVTQFDVQRRSSGGGIPGAGGSVEKTEAYVKLSTRVVSTVTGEILAVGEGNGTAEQSDTQVRVFGIGAGAATDNTGKLLTFATEEAIDQSIEQIITQKDKMLAVSGSGVGIDSLVAYVDGNTVILNKGSRDGYTVGMRLTVERVTQEVKDPQTGEVIHRISDQIGEIEITSVEPQSSVGRTVSGAGLTIGDVAKPSN